MQRREGGRKVGEERKKAKWGGKVMDEDGRRKRRLKGEKGKSRIGRLKKKAKKCKRVG